MCRNNLILAVALGIIIPAIGIFVGLQVSTVFGNILAFPVVILSTLTGVPFGMWHPVMWLFAFSFSIAIWIAMIYVVGKFRKL